MNAHYHSVQNPWSSIPSTQKNEQIKNKDLSCLLFRTDEELRFSRQEQNTVGAV